MHNKFPPPQKRQFNSSHNRLRAVNMAMMNEGEPVETSPIDTNKMGTMPELSLQGLGGFLFVFVTYVLPHTTVICFGFYLKMSTGDLLATLLNQLGLNNSSATNASKNKEVIIFNDLTTGAWNMFVRDNNCTIEFDAYGFSIKDFMTRRVLLRCDSTGDLYPVTHPSPIPHAFLVSQHTWHKRLGHPGGDVLRRLVSNNVISCNNEKPPVLCHACQLGKHVRLPFVSSNTVVTSCFDIVHSDVWTSPIPSLSGFKYYVLFLDHYSQFVWVYPLLNKSDVWSKFVLFHTYVRTQFKCEIRSFQCDHGGEFDNRNLHKLFAENGIQFRFSCPKTSQQNGKSRSLLWAQAAPRAWYSAVLHLYITRVGFIRAVSSSQLFVTSELLLPLPCHGKIYVVEILERAHMANCNPCRTPVDTESKLRNDDDPVSDPTLYRSLAGNVRWYFGLWVAVVLSLPLHHWLPTQMRIRLVALPLGDLLLVIVCFLATTYSPGPLKCVNSRFLVHMCSEEQEFRLVLPISASAVEKHIEIDIHFVRDLVTLVRVRVLYVPSRYQYADIFTKDCLNIATYLINKLLTPVLEHKSPYELLYHKPPSLEHLRTIGCRAYMHQHTPDKFHPRAIPTVLLGYPQTQKGYLLYDPITTKVHTSRHVTFEENIFPFQTTHTQTPSPPLTPQTNPFSFTTSPSSIPSTSPIPNTHSPNSSPKPTPTQPSPISSPTQSPTPIPTPSPTPTQTSTTKPVPNTSLSPSPIQTSTTELEPTPSPEHSLPSPEHTTPTIPLRTSTIIKTQPAKLSDYLCKLPPSLSKHHHSNFLNYSNLSHKSFHFINNINILVKPHTYIQASKNPKWIEAMNKEIQALKANHTWTLTQLPPGKSPIGSKWVFKIKYHSNGSVERYKARVVAKGFNKKEGIDYKETYAPVAKMVTVRTLLVVAITQN
ncbi:ribonuclease H-like domain-containing protein [Tanacetum coccineum]